MAPRNVAKAVGVWLLLLALFWLLICAQPQPSLRACTGDPPKPAAPEMSKASPSQEPDIPLELRMKIDPRVLKAFLSGSQSLDGRSERQRQARYIVHLTPRADLSTHVHAADLAQRRQAVVESLRRAADESQAALVTFLESQRASGAVREFTEYWVFNGLAVTSDLQTLLDIAVRPEVGTIREDRVHHLPPVGESKATSTCQAIEWNISQVEADRVWSAYGLQGDGVVVATLDSGVDWTHPALQRKYRGYDPTDPDQAQHDYNWFDATQTYPDAPQDGDGHGTHTMGTLVGSLPDGPNQVGVAPGAQWIAAKVFDDAGETLDSWLHAGFQWILAPTDRNGQNADPAKAPDICNNSWGDSDGDETTFWDDVLALRAAGIFPVFAVGNKYQGSLAAHAPGTFPQAVAVGATDRNDVVASWSCRGPSPWNEIKPEIAAPGAGVRSTFPGNQYAVLDGTSMAVPHVAGVAALLWEAYEEYGTIHSLSSSQLDVSAMERIITQTAHPLPDAEAVPNNDYGWGRIDAYQAVGAIAQGGDFLGRVTDVGTGQGVSGATVVMLNRDFGGTSRAGTDPQGYYTFAVAAGLYDVTAAQFYYAPRSATAVEILAQTTTQLDFRLTPLPAGQVLGRVVDVATGQPVEATVREIDRLAHVTTDASGYYTLTLPLGRHVLEAVPLVAGHSLARVTVTLDSEGQTTVQGFFLDAIPKVLLVDADAWVSGGTVAHYQRSLEALSYSFDMWTVSDRSSSGIGSFPPAETMQDYDLVIWAQPLSSPGYIGAWPALASYLDLGKTLLISGQDIGFWDVQREFGADDYEAYLHASYERDDAGIQEVVGLPGTFLGGLSLTLGTPDSAQNQDAPSEIAPSDGLAVPVLDYVGDGHAALAIDECEGHRAAYLSFGLEGSGPEGARTQVLGRVLQWLAEPRPDYGLSLAVPRQWATGEPAGQARFAVSVLNTGLKADSYRLSVVGNRWSATTLDTTGRNGVTSTVVVSPCSSLDLTLVVDVAGSAVTGQSDAMTLSVRSQAAPAVVQERVIEVTASMPWTSVPPLPTARYRAAAAAVAECQFFVIGGWSDDELATQTNDMYDVRTGSWQAMAAKPTATANTAAAVIGGSVYVPGGLQGDTRIKALEIYEPDADRWVQGADLPQAVASSAVASANGKLYVFGGSDADGTLLDTTLEYDPATDDWSTRTPLPSGPRAYAAAAELGGKLYVAGGWPSLRNLECYDPVADSWTALAPLPTGRHSLGLVVLEGAVYAVGGGDSWTGLAAVERYDPPTDSWVTLTPLSSAARAGAAVSAVAGRLHVVGGTDEDNGTVSAHEALAVGASLGDSSLMADRKVIAAGQETTFVITLRNPGQQAIHQALFYDDIPVHATYVTGSVAGGATYNPSANRVEWQGPMAARSSKVLQFQVKLPEELPRGTLITNTAWVDDGLCGGQPISALVTIEAADLSASHKAVDRATARGGEELLYSIDLRNVGAFTSSVVRLEDPVPGELAYVPGSVVGGTYNDGLDQIEWSGVLPPGAEGSYRWLDSNTGGVVYEWLNATDGIAVPDGGDDVALGPFDIGFPFAFYGQEYTEFYLNTNGQVLFGAGSLAYSNVPIPNPSTPNNFLAAFWDDLVSEEGTLFYKLVGSAPARRLVIEWEGVRRYSVESELTFEVILHEGSNEVVVQYATLEGASADGESATVGIEDGSGGEGVEYQYNDEGPGYPLHPGLAVLFAPVARHYVAFRATLPRDIPLGTQVSNEALLTHDEGPPLVLTATTRVGLTELPHAKTVDKLVAISGEELSYFIQLSNVDIVTPTQAQVVDPLPANLTYVPGSVVGGTYNDGLDQIEWSGVLPPGAEGTYRWFDSDTGGVVYEWLDATDGIKVPEGGDDRALGPFDIGFPFTFYGVEHTEFYLNTNGQVLFGTGSLAYSNVRIPNSSPPNNFVAAFWDDLVSEEGTLFHKLVGSAPARRLVIEWEGVRRYSGDTRLTFEVILREGSDEVVVQYAILEGASADGESATVGLEDGSGGEGVEYQYNDVGPGYPLHPGLAVLFTPAPKGHEVSFRARVAGDLPVNTLITNEALAGLGDQAPLSLTATTWVNQVDLSTSSLGVDHTEAPVGELLTYDIRLHNSGNVAAAHVSLVNPIPRGTQYVDGSVAGGATYDPGSERVTWGGSVPPRLSVPISFAVKTSQAAPHNTPITNVVAIDAGQGSWITRTVVTVLQSFDLNASDKVMPPRAGPGEVIGCSVRLRNMGAISASAVLTDTLPTGMTLVPGSLWASSGQAHSEAGAIVWHGEIVARGMVIVRFLALVDPAIEVGTSLVNTARIKDSLGHAYERTSRTLVYDPAATVFLPIVRK